MAIFVVMSTQEARDTIKSTVHSFLPGAKVLLFGSQAKGIASKDSDYDVLIITQNMMPQTEKRDLRGKIAWALVKKVHAPFDVICHSQEEVNVYKNYTGHIVRYAMQEAIQL